jgi:alpha/beta superfamily hydrolase
MSDAYTLTTSDALHLEAELAAPPAEVAPRFACVLCHPHPLHGGSMQSIVISSLFHALPKLGVTTMRFNYRGVGGSEGTYGDGIGEQLDARAAIDTLLAATNNTLPLIVIGWSFGGDVTLALADSRAVALVAIAPPLRYGERVDALEHDPRAKLLIMAGADEVINNEPALTAAASWPNTDVITITGASHFFIGRTEKIADAVAAFIDGLAT